MNEKLSAAQRGQVRLATIVIVVTMPLWVGFTYLGGKYGFQPRFAFLADFTALAAFVFALIVVFRVWRQRRLHGS